MRHALVGALVLFFLVPSVSSLAVAEFGDSVARAQGMVTSDAVRVDPCRDMDDWLTFSALRYFEGFHESRRIVDALFGEITAVVPGKDYPGAIQALADAQRRSAPPVAGEDSNDALIELFDAYTRFADEAMPRLQPEAHASHPWVQGRLREFDRLESAAERATALLVHECGLSSAATPVVPSATAVADTPAPGTGGATTDADW